MNTATLNPPAIIQSAEDAATVRHVAEDATLERHGVCAVYFRINGTLYAAKCIRTAAGKVWRLRKPDGTAYDVCRGTEGMICDCWDWVARWANKEGDGCKHCRALRAAGLLD